MKIIKAITALILACMLVLTNITPVFVAASTDNSENVASNIEEFYDSFKEIYWEKQKQKNNLNEWQLLALSQMQVADMDTLQQKINEPKYKLTTTTTSAMLMSFVATQANPYTFKDVDYVSQLVGNQRSGGYFTFDDQSDIDKNAESLIKATLALELANASYNKDSAKTYLMSFIEPTEKGNHKVKVKIFDDGTINAQAAYLLHLYGIEPTIQKSLLKQIKEESKLTTQGIAAYLMTLYAIGEDPNDDQWRIHELTTEELWNQLIIKGDGENELDFTTSLQDSKPLESVNATEWALLGLHSSIQEKSSFDQIKEDYSKVDFKLVPKTIEINNMLHPYMNLHASFKPEFSVKDQYGSVMKLPVQMVSADESIVKITKNNELVANAVGRTQIIAFVDNKYLVRDVQVIDDPVLMAIVPTLGQSLSYLLKNDDIFTSFEEMLAVSRFGNIHYASKINIYSNNDDVYNTARNILSIVAAEQDPTVYNGFNYIKKLDDLITKKETLTTKEAAYSVIAQLKAAQEVSPKAIQQLANYKEVSLNDLTMISQAIHYINQQQLADLSENEKAILTFLESKDEKKLNISLAATLLNYKALYQEPVLEKFNRVDLAQVILKNFNTTNYSIRGLGNEGLLVSTATALNAISTLFTHENAYVATSPIETDEVKAIVIDSAKQLKINQPSYFTAKVIDHHGNVLDTPITWLVNGQEVSLPYTPTALGEHIITAKVNQITANQHVEVIDYKKVNTIKITPFKSVVTDEVITLHAKVVDSEGQEVKMPITWQVSPNKNIQLENNQVRFYQAGVYQVRASVGNVEAQAEVIEVTTNPDSIHTQVQVAVDKMKLYLENRKQYDYISALAYARVIDNNKLSQKNMRELGHLREYGNHDGKYALYYAKNIIQAVAASENSTQYKSYKGQIVDLKNTLLQSQDEDGHFTMFTNFDKKSVSTQVWSIIALDLIEAEYQQEKAIQDLIRGLNAPLTEGAYQEQELRALSLIALSKHRNKPGVEEQITRNITYLKTQQNKDGGFNYGGYTNNPFAIGTVIQGLIAVGESPYDAKWKKNGVTMVEVLLRQQIENGGFTFGDEFKGDVAFDELKSTEAAFGALADLYTKKSIFNYHATIVDQPLDIPTHTKPFIEVEQIEVASDQPLLTLQVSATDNIDGELPPEVTVNKKAIYATTNRYKAILQQGDNEVTVATQNRAGMRVEETFIIPLAKAPTQKVPQAKVNVKGLNGKLLSAKDIILEDGDTAYSVLVKAVGNSNIDARVIDHHTYVSSIHQLGEFEHGEGSGWLYKINDIYPKQYAGLFVLKPGDVMEWVYTKDYGKDVGVPWLDPVPPIVDTKLYVPSTKTWKITMSNHVREESLKNGIFVENRVNGKKESITFKVDKNVIYIYAPQTGYQKGDYRLVVNQQIQSHQSITHEKSIEKEFSVK